MAAPQGLTISLRASQGQVAALAVHSSRSSAVQSWTVGAAPAEAALRLGLAFALCRMAQRTACSMALEAAGAATERAASMPERAWDLTYEWVREHACNLFLSWPSVTGDDQQVALVRALRVEAADPEAARRALHAALAREVLAMDPMRWLSLDADGFQAWCARRATPTSRRLAGWVGATAHAQAADFLPPVAHWTADTAQSIDAAVRADPGFGLRPCWNGKPAETGALARVQGHSLVRAWLDLSGNDAGARLLARLLEMSQWACERAPAPQDVMKAWSTGPGCGLAAVETSRGVLVHRVCLVHGRVAEYGIVAPTEWNFHPDGLLRQVLVGGTGGDGLEFQARAWSLALDPCVDCEVELSHA